MLVNKEWLGAVLPANPMPGLNFLFTNIDFNINIF